MASSQTLHTRKLIREHAAGRTYVDIGGLWGTKGETITVAIESGASHATMADIQPLGNRWWKAFEEHCEAKGISGYSEKQVDICAPGAPAELGTYDFVHCAGVMYHVADLFAFIGNLRSVTNEYLMISSAVMPDTMTNAKGTLVFGPDHSYLTPVLSEENRAIVVEYLQSNGRRAAGLTHDTPLFDGARPLNGPWWWLYSGEFMSRVISMHHMEVVAEGPSPNGNVYTVFAKVTAA
ncbi:MAG: hypothetical protein J2P57_09300 [Acidimicrobiaceae bacterium]|nr:hypothetical protein [Acidimicrobiaceae bacterium]